MSIKIGCFALVDPFNTLDHQLNRIRDWGFRFADVTDTGDGATLGNHFGFTSVSSLDDNPFDTKRLFEERVGAEAFASYLHGHVGPGDGFDQFRAGGSVTWRIRDWLHTAITYEFRRRGSSFANDDFRWHRVEVSLGFGL